MRGDFIRLFPPGNSGCMELSGQVGVTDSVDDDAVWIDKSSGRQESGNGRQDIPYRPGVWWKIARNWLQERLHRYVLHDSLMLWRSFIIYFHYWTAELKCATHTHTCVRTRVTALGCIFRKYLETTTMLLAKHTEDNRSRQKLRNILKIKCYNIVSLCPIHV